MSSCRRTVAVVAWAMMLGVGAGAQEIEIPPLPTAEDLEKAPSFSVNDRLVATHYFYWYRWPDQHFFDNYAERDDALRHHFPDHREVSYESEAWHRQQMEDLLAAGIDVALPVYWGAPNQYEHPAIRFSVDGLPPLVAALDGLQAELGRAPRIGMFYDTSTLLGEYAFTDDREHNVDLRTDEGKDVFYRTIRDFFRQVPPRHWACIEDRPIVQLYTSAFAVGHDASLLTYVSEHFSRDFHGRRPLIIAGPSWRLPTQMNTGWGAALGGPIVGSQAAQVGPGYDDSPVPKRTTPTRDRLGGGFYSASWLLALQARPRLVIVETWNELHEGTGVCETLEDGRHYIEITRHYSDLFKAGAKPGGDDWAKALDSVLGARHSQREGREFASELELHCRVTAGGELVEGGLDVVRGVGDGLFELGAVDGTPCVLTRRGALEHRYLYFDIADPYYYDHRGELRVRFTYFDAGDHDILVQYDSTRDTGTLHDYYRELPQRIHRGDTRTWKTVEVALPGARCMNRQNGGADFRLVSLDDDLALREIGVSKLPADYAERSAAGE